MIHVSILGATGYSGGELLRLLISHPNVKIQHVTSTSAVGQDVGAVHPFLRKRLSLQFEKPNVGTLSADSDVVFSCYPHGAGLKSTASFIKKGIKVIDLSADFRLPQAKMYQSWYKTKHTAPQLLSKAVYGLPELFRDDIRQAQLIANPGCYTTAAILSAAPLVQNRIIDARSIIVDAKSGVTGAGKKLAPQYLFNEVDANFQAYGVASHRHQPEMESVLSRVSKRSVQITFTPHLVPMKRGIFSVLYASLTKRIHIKDVRSLFIRAYETEPFVRILPESVLPQTKNVNHTNYCDIGIAQDPRSKRVIILAALDNLVKGAAGQAVQNMNIMFDRAEIEGLH